MTLSSTMTKIHTHTNDRRIRRYLHKYSYKLPKIDMRQPHHRWWIITLIFALGVIAFFLSPLMRLKSVTCHTDTGEPCPDFVVPEIEKYKGQLMYLLPLSLLADKIHSVAPQLGSIELTRLWPNQLTVKLVTQIPCANLQIPTSNRALLVSQNRYILAFQDQPNETLPTIIASQAAELTVGDRVKDQSLTTAIELVQAIPDITGNQLFQITVFSPLNIQVTTTNHQHYLFTSNRPINDQLHALQLILGTTTIETTTRIIDVRPDKPVIKVTR